MDDSPKVDRNQLQVRGQNQVVAVVVMAQHAESCRDGGFGWTEIGRQAKIKEELIDGVNGGDVKSDVRVVLVLTGKSIVFDRRENCRRPARHPVKLVIKRARA